MGFTTPVLRLVAGAVALGLLMGTAEAQTSLRMATSWPGGPHMEVFAKGFVRNVEQLTGGKADLRYRYVPFPQKVEVTVRP